MSVENSRADISGCNIGESDGVGGTAVDDAGCESDITSFRPTCRMLGRPSGRVVARANASRIDQKIAPILRPNSTDIPIE